MFYLNMVDYTVFFPVLSTLTWDTLLALRSTWGFSLNHLIPLGTFKSVFDNVLLEHGGLPHVLPLAVHLIFTWTGREGHPKSLLLFEFSCWRPPSCLKVVGGVGWVAHKSLVSAPVPLQLIGIWVWLGWGWALGIWVWGPGLTIQWCLPSLWKCINRILYCNFRHYGSVLNNRLLILIS